MKIKVRMIDGNIEKFKKIEKGDWIDTRVSTVAIVENTKESISNGFKQCEDLNKFEYKSGQVVIIRLGFAMELPEGYEAELKSRSGTFKETGLILTNAVGCVDESYKGNNDEWIMCFYATRDGSICKNDRVGQFRINKKMPALDFEYVDNLEGEDRGGFNSTGLK